MKQSKVMQAYKSVQSLNRQKLSGQMAKKVFLLFTALQPAWDFQIQEEEKIFSDNPMYDPQINGIHIPEDEEGKAKAIEEAKKLNDELKAIADIDYEIEFEKFDFDLSKENIKLSGEDIGNLEEFINFI